MTTLNIIIIPGGRAGSKPVTIAEQIPDNINERAEWFNDILDEVLELENLESITPNSDKDIPDMIDAIEGKTDRWVGWDVFGEGIIGISLTDTHDKLLLEVLKAYNGC